MKPLQRSAHRLIWIVLVVVIGILIYFALTSIPEFPLNKATSEALIHRPFINTIDLLWV